MAKSNKGRKFFATTATAALVASAIVPVASAAQINDFNSIASYAQEAVQDLVDRGVVEGDANGNFSPAKSVTRAEAATVLTKALGLTTDSEVYFTDVKAGAWYYDAINAAVNNGVFSGQGAGKFNPTGNLTRGEAAVILVNAFGLEGSASLAQFADEKTVKAWAKDALEIAVANGVIKGDNGQIKANHAITKQDFAVMFSRAEAASDLVSASTVKAINNTTVEVLFDGPIADVKALDFKIEGLEVKNAVVKQTASNTAVLTTAAQEAGKEYTVTVNGKSVGKFTGVAAVIPTAVSISEKSLQAPVGTQVTLKAQVTVKEGESKENIPVTFNIVNNASIGTATLNQPIVVEAFTDANGVATYTYTRYAQTTYQIASHDEVQAYATGNPTARSFSKVYWANIQPLTLTEITEGNAIQNGAKKVYKVKVALEHAEKITNAAGVVTGYKVNVGYQENLNVAPDKAVKTVDVIDSKGQNLSYPGQFTSSTTGANDLNNWAKEVELVLDANGEAIFTLSGNNAAITPFVFVDQKVNPSNAAGTIARFEETELFATAPKVTFAKQQTLGLALEAVGVQYAASFLDTDNNKLADSLEAIAVDGSKTFTAAALRTALVNTGGRDYKATLTDTNGKTAPAGTSVRAEINLGSALKTNGGAVYLVDNNTRTVHKLTNDASTPAAGTKKTVELKTDAKGAVSFTLIGAKDAYATPTLYVETGDKPGLDKNDLQQVGEIVYFSDAVVKTASLTVSDKSVTAADEVEYTYATVDQNGKAYRPADANYLVTFQVSTTFNPVSVRPGTGTGFVTGTNTNGSYIINPAAVLVGQGSTGQYNYSLNNYETVVVQTDAQGVASIKVSSANGIATSVNVIGSASVASLPQNLTAGNEFTTYATKDLHAKVNTVDATNNVVTVSDVNNKAYTYSYTGARLQINGTDAVSETAFEAALATAIANPLTQSLSIKLVDGVYVFNVLTTTPAPTVPGTNTGVITKAEITAVNKLTVTFSSAPTLGTPPNLSQYTFDFNNNGVIDSGEIATGATVGTANDIEFTFTAITSATPATAVGTFKYTPGTVAAEYLKIGTSTINSALTAPVVVAAQPSGVTTAPPTLAINGVTAVQRVAKAQIVSVSGVTTAGNIDIILTATELVGTPLTLTIPVALNDTKEVVASKVRAALAGNTNVADKFTVSGTDAEIIVTPKAATDATNVANTIALTVAPSGTGGAVGLAATTTTGTVSPGVVGVAEVNTITVTAATALTTGSIKPLTIRVQQSSPTDLVGIDRLVTVAITTADTTVNAVANKIKAALDADSVLAGKFDVTVTTGTGVVTLTNKTTGDVTTTITVTP